MRVRLLSVAALGLLFAILTAAPALAHATLVSSTPSDGAVLPAAPAQVTLTYDESVRPVSADIKVLDPAGGTVNGAVTGAGPKVKIALKPLSKQGTYTVSWRVISADSHPIEGAVTFSVGYPTKPATVHGAQAGAVVSTLFTVARFLAYLGFAVLVGSVAFCCYGARDAWGLQAVRLLIISAWAAMVVGTFGSLVLQGPYAAGGGLGGVFHAGLLGQTLGTTYGKALAFRLVLLGLSPALLAYAMSMPGMRGTEMWLFGGIGAVVAAGMSATWSLGGHAATSSQPAGTVPADMAHLCAMALWLGGLATVVIVVRARPPGAEAGVARFSEVAGWCITVLAGTGIYQALLRVETLPALFSTSYGIELLVKVSVVCAILATAFFSRRAVHAGLVMASRLGRLVVFEAAGAVVVLAVTSILVETQPAGQAFAAQPVTMRARYDTQGPGGAGALQVRLPSRARGLTQAAVAIEDAQGRARDVPEVDLAWALPSRGIGPITAKVTRVGAGRYQAIASPLVSAGRWRLSVTVRTDPIDVTTVGLSVDIR